MKRGLSAREELKDVMESEKEDGKELSYNLGMKRLKNEEGSGVSDTSSEAQSFEDPEKLQKMAAAFKTILECCGEDVYREGLLSTPMRVRFLYRSCLLHTSIHEYKKEVNNLPTRVMYKK